MKPLNQRAQNAYADAHVEATRLASLIMDQLNDLPCPDQETNWGQVGDLHSIIVNLRHALLAEEAA